MTPLRRSVLSLTRTFSLVMVVGVSAFEGLSAPASAAPQHLIPLQSVRLLPGPFSEAVEANRAYVLQHDVDRLVAPFRREAGLEPKKPQYADWENGLDGHTGGHYLSALAGMIAAGADTPDRELKSRLDYMVSELGHCQAAAGDGYIGGVSGSKEFWEQIAAGKIEATGFGLNGKWVPWYNLHKTFAGLRDAYLWGGNEQAKRIFIDYGDWVGRLFASLSDEQVQTMLRAEHGGMNEVLADLYSITGEDKYLALARRFSHRAVLDPLIQGEDRLTGLHANTQIPKVVGLQRIGALGGDGAAQAGARFFWQTVTKNRSVAFGGNSVSEHFNDPKNFQGLLQHREGPETCNTYNMLRLTEQLFEAEPSAGYVDYYERALYNHILASIHPQAPGYVYFTPIRPGHYRVYSNPEHHFWCCVGSGMENPGRYGQFVYARSRDGVYVNLFLPSELRSEELGMTLRQETRFPDEEATRLTLNLSAPKTFSVHLRHPAWVSAGALKVRVNGEGVSLNSQPSTYAAIRREWRSGDRIEIELPMQTTLERMPDGSDWYAILRGPIVLAARTGTEQMAGLRAEDRRGSHVARGPIVPLDQATVLLTTAAELPGKISRVPEAGPLHFRMIDVAHPGTSEGVLLEPFFRIHDSRYQMYWELTTKEGLAAKQERRALEERQRLAREAATLDSVAVGEQQPEVDHGFVGEGTDSGEFQERRWRHGKWFQYQLNTRGEKDLVLSVTYSGWDRDRHFDVLANGIVLAAEHLDGKRAGEFFDRLYPISPEVLAAGENGRVTVRFSGKNGSLAGGVYDVRLMRRP